MQTIVIVRARRLCASFAIVSVLLPLAAAAAQDALSLVNAALPAGGQATSVVPDNRVLYLRAGAIDTRALPSLLTVGAVYEQSERYVVQLDGPITPARRAALEACGAWLHEYLPMHAYIAALGDVRADTLLQLGFVVWIGRFDPAWKLCPEIGNKQFETPERQELAAAGKLRLVVSCFADAPPDARFAARLASRGASLSASGLNQRTRSTEIEIPAEHISELTTLPEVMFIEEAPEGLPRNASTTWICQSNTADATPLWDHGLRGEGQMAGIIDWAMRETHCAFADPEGDPIGPLHRKIEAYYGLGQSSVYAYHGTHVSGVLIGEDPAQSDANLRGMAYEGRVVFQHYNAVITPTSLNARLTVAHNHGARVHNNSWGSSDRQYIAWSRDIDVFTRDHEDDLVLVAVTNSNIQVQAPENSKNNLAVAATLDSPSQDYRCYGGYGPTLDGRQKPEVWAPGCGSISAGTTPCNTNSGGGTSYATPAVAGMGLLVRQYFTEGFHPTGSATPGNAFVPSGALLKAVLINSAVDMTGLAGYFTVNEGWGRIKVDDALFFAGDARRLIVADVRNASGLSTGQGHDYFITCRSANQPLKITLVWTDVPATLGASYTPVNNLDLVVTSPFNMVYRGNVFSGTQSAPGGAADAVNNAEQVHRNAPLTGTWRIDVLGTAVNQDVQGYALVITGDVRAGPALCGDLDYDLDVDGDDYAIFLSAFGASSGEPRYLPAADLDYDGLVSLVDYQLWVLCYRDFVGDPFAPPPPPGLLGDLNADGKADGLDVPGFVAVVMDPESASARDRAVSDINGDQQIDPADVPPFVDWLLQQP